jgi:plasmid stability protein
MRAIQIRHVPDDVHRVLKARAAQAGQTLSDYLLAQLSGIARRPTTEELLGRIRARDDERPRTASAKAVRLERESRR